MRSMSSHSCTATKSCLTGLALIVLAGVQNGCKSYTGAVDRTGAPTATSVAVEAGGPRDSYKVLGEVEDSSYLRVKRLSVRVEIPVDVVDALLSGDGDRLNLVGALERLKERRGDLVRIIDGDERVHIWIDEEQG